MRGAAITCFLPCSMRLCSHHGSFSRVCTVCRGPWVVQQRAPQGSNSCRVAKNLWNQKQPKSSGSVIYRACEVWDEEAHGGEFSVGATLQLSGAKDVGKSSRG